MTEIDSGNTAWVLASAALVLFMTPGLAFFYAGMVRSKHVLGMLMQNFFSMGLVSVLWVLVGFSLAFGDGGGLDRKLRLRRPQGPRDDPEPARLRGPSRSRCPCSLFCGLPDDVRGHHARPDHGRDR